MLEMACNRDDTPFGAKTSGVSLSLDVAAVLGSKLVLAQFRQQLLAVLIGGASLSLVVQGLDRCTDAVQAFASFCEYVAGVVRTAATSPTRIGIVIDSRDLRPRTAWCLRHRLLGAGPLYVQLQAVPGGYWHELWQLRMNPMLRPVYALTVTSHCRLLSAENALAVLPGVDIQAPVGSAWVAMRFDVSRYTNGRELGKDLRRAVVTGERLHRSTRWPTAQMRHDAWLNRRLAIELTGLGDLIEQSGRNPLEASGFEFASRHVRGIVNIMHRQSRRMADEQGGVPALAHRNPAHNLPGGRLRDDWNRRWRQALGKHSVRHRNLLVLQPWCVFPSQKPVDIRYSNLLPLLRYADACAFPAPPNIAHWNVNEFKNFHQRARAALQQRDAAHQIAEHV